MRKIFDINLIQQNDINMGITCRGDTLVSPSDKGSFSGKDIKGQVMPTGNGDESFSQYGRLCGTKTYGG